MEGKLIKVHQGYYLEEVFEPVARGSAMPQIFASTYGDGYNKISLKNCQAIERGYDLDELADELSDKHNNRFTLALVALRRGMELMADKRFTEDDMRKAYRKGEYDAYYVGAVSEKENNYIQSLQQTEWDCIIFVDEKTNQPLLDNEGNLILKRK